MTNKQKGMEIGDVEITSEVRHLTVDVVMNDEEERTISVFVDSIVDSQTSILDLPLLDNIKIDDLSCDQPKDKKEEKEIIEFVKNNLNQ